MKKTELLNFFEEKIRVKILEFCDKINQSEADLYILMARKAACFVNVLEEVSLISINGKVISERLLDTQINWKNIKRIIIIDDVIISGTTLNRTLKSLKLINPNFDISVFVIGINDRWFNKQLLEDDYGASYIHYPIKPLDNAQCIRLSGDIVRLLAIYPMPYNIDFPIYQTIKFTHGTFQKILSIPGWEISDISSLSQKKEDVFALTFIPSNEHLERCGKLFFNDLIKNSLLKVRVYGKKTKQKEVVSFSVVPMAVLPPLKSDQIQMLFQELAGSQFTSLSENMFSLTSRLRFIQFIIADCLAGLFLNEVDRYTNKTVKLNRKHSSLRLLFPEELISTILKIADNQLIDVDLQYNKQDIPVKEINYKFSIDDYIEVNNALMLPFLDIYYQLELPARQLALDFGKNVFELPEYKSKIDRLNKGYSYLELENILKDFPYEVRKRILSAFLDRAIDNGIAVPITVIEGNIAYRAYRHGEDVQFGQREERLCLEMFNAFTNKITRTTFQKLWIEKLFVFFLKIGEEKFLEPIQTEISNYQNINGKEKNLADIASVRYYFQGPVVVRKRVDLDKPYNFNPCLDLSDKASWLSKYLINNSKCLTVTEGGLYAFDKTRFKEDNYTKKADEIIIDKELVKQPIEIGSLFGLLIDNNEKKIKPSLNSDDLVALSACCEPKDVIGALAAEIFLSSKIWNIQSDKDATEGVIQRSITSAYQNKALVPEAIQKIRTSPFYRAINDGQRKFEWYLTKYPKTIIENITSEFDDIVYRGIWESFWSPNMDWSESSENSKLVELAKVEGIWILCFNLYVSIIEYCLLFENGEVADINKAQLKVKDYGQRIKFFASHSKTRQVISLINQFERNAEDLIFQKALIPEILDKINHLTFASRDIVSDAEEVFSSYKVFPDIQHFNHAFYIEPENQDAITTITNVFNSICFKITKTKEDNIAVVKGVPVYDYVMDAKNGRWFVANGKGAAFWLCQFATELINTMSYKHTTRYF
jgi:hypothetical protein